MGIKETLTKKWHGIPVWVLALGTAVVMYFLYHWYQNRTPSSANTNSSLITPTAPASTDSGGTIAPGTGSTSPIDTSSPGVSGNYDPSAFAGLIASDLATVLQSGNPTDVTTPTDLTNLNPSGPDTEILSSPAPIVSSPTVKVTGGKVATTKLPTTSKLTKILPSGAKIFTTSTGAKIEEAPGKSPYRISSAPGKTKAKSKNSKVA